MVRWFKLWNSGYLEHGGTIDINNKTEYETINNNIITINLRWKFDNNQIAPVYDYPTLLIQPFYQKDIPFINSILQYDNNDNIKHDNSYCITVTPKQINNNNPFIKNGNNICEVNTIKNGSFCFIPNCNQSIYSYYCSGFTVSQVKKLKYELNNQSDTDGIESSKYVTIRFISDFKEIFNKTINKNQSLSEFIEYSAFMNISKDIPNFYDWSTTDDDFNRFDINSIITKDTIIVSFLGTDGYHYCSSPNIVNATQFTITGNNFTINKAHAVNNTYIQYNEKSQHEVNLEKSDTYVVTFIDYDYSVLKRSYINRGQSAVPPLKPTRSGYVFNSWSHDYTNIQSDLTIQATYKKI